MMLIDGKSNGDPIRKVGISKGNTQDKTKKQSQVSYSTSKRS
jgi:hypothetical protein